MPLELLLDVIKLLSKRDKKTIRLVSKVLSVLATPLVFDSIYLSLNPEDLNKAHLALKNHASSINTIVLHPLRIWKMHGRDYKDLVKREISLPDPSPYRWRLEEHVNMGWKALSTIHRLGFKYDVMPIFQPIFWSILRDSPNLRKIVITDRKRYAELDIAKVCRWEDCAIPAEMHEVFELTPMQCSAHTSAYLLDRSSRLHFTDLKWMQSAFSESGTNLRELVVEHERTSTSLIRKQMQSFLSFTEDLIKVSGLMSRLTKLKLTVDDRKFTIQIPYPVEGDKYAGQRNKIYFRTRMVANRLACAENLENLSLMIDNCIIEDHVGLSPSMFHYILQGCRFPKLRIFVLNGCAMEGEEIMGFLDGSPELRHLVLGSCLLQRCEWASLVELIKKTTNLAALLLVNLLGRSWNGPEYLTRFVDYDNLVEKFLRDGGPNPFVYDSQVDYEKKWRAATDPAVLDAARKVDWYNGTYF